MKLFEVLDAPTMIKRIGPLKGKPQSTRALVKTLRRNRKKNRKTPDTKQDSIYANHDGMVGTGTDTFDQNNWK